MLNLSLISKINMKTIILGSTIINIKSGKSFKVMGFEGCMAILKPVDGGKEFIQAVFAVKKFYSIKGETNGRI